MADGTLNVTPFMDVGGNGKSHDGMGMGGGFIWVILILFLLIGGNGFGGFGGANATTNQLNADFLYTQQKIDGQTAAMNAGFTGTNQAINNGFAINAQALCNGFAGVNSGICDLRHSMDLGFCGVGRSIDQVRFEAQQNTCAITTAISNSTQAVKDLINANTMQDQRDRNGDLSNALNNAQQTATIINQIRPYPTPSYFAPNPNASIPFAAYAPFMPFGGCAPCGGGDGCGHGVL